MENLRKAYPTGTRLELLSLNDEIYSHILKPGNKGTVMLVDDTGIIHVKWDFGRAFGICHGTYECRKID